MNVLRGVRGGVSMIKKPVMSRFISNDTQKSLRIGYVPEHFSTPFHFAKKYFGLGYPLIAFPSGTGHMIESLRSGEIDIGIGLTEGWVAGLGKKREGFQLIGTYVESPLCWSISVGSSSFLKDVEQLRNSKMGVSRIGSGSYVMGHVLADERGWLKGSTPFEVVPLNDFANLRRGVNDGTADFFMWEHFTSKRYYDNGEIKRIGEIYTPWSSWKIVASDRLLGDTKVLPEKIDQILDQINHGIDHFNKNKDEAIRYISTQLDYSEEDAKAWMDTVKFPNEVRGVKTEVIDQTISSLFKAGVLKGHVDSQDMIFAHR